MKHLPRIVHYLRPYLSLVVASGVLVLLAAAVGLAVPWPLKILVDRYIVLRWSAIVRTSPQVSDAVAGVS